jgi:ABC-type transport system involved in cytochrome bd biosynthesis fused ATPase/permease subunit
VLLVVMSTLEVPQTLVPALEGLGKYRASWRRLREIGRAQPVVVSPAVPAPAPAGRRLDVRNLTFRYPDAGEAGGIDALSDVSLSLTRGRLVALVGASGSGKSTLMSLLARHWPVEAGTVLIDDVDVCALTVADARRCCSVAAQPVDILTGTMIENLCLGLPRDDRRAWQVLEEVGLDAAVRRMPDRLDTWVGEQGTALSGGQQQRLALARALLRTAPFLLLDEPTAHLDAEAERDVLRLLARERARRGILLTTHRVHALGLADEIVVLQQGRVIQRGTFSQLASRPGWFRDMLALQSVE